MPTITTKLQDKTYKILHLFIRDTANLTVNNDLERIILLQKTDKLFTALSELSKKEFAKIFTVINFTSSDVKENEKYQEIFNYLLTAVIEKYSQTDLLRYFFPELSQKETRPEYSNNSWRISHWVQLIGYWLRQLQNKPTYTLKTEHNRLADSIQYLKTSISNKDYIDNDLNQDFKQHLAVLREKTVEKAIFPLRNEISRINSIPDQIYHQQLLDKYQALQALEKDLYTLALELDKKDKELDKKDKELDKKETELKIREEQATQSQRTNAEVLELYRGEREAVKRQQESLHAQQELIMKEREAEKEAFEAKREMLQEKISGLEGQLLAKEEYIQTLEKVVQEGKVELTQMEKKLLENEQLFEERLAVLTAHEETFREKSKLLAENREEMEKQKKDLEKEIKTLNETISKLKENKLTEKKYYKKIENDHIDLLAGIQELVNDMDVVSLSSSYTSAAEPSELSDAPLRTSSSPNFFKQPAANHPNLDTSGHYFGR